jgi:hypothetical protein
MSGPPYDASIHLRTRTPGPKEQDLINQFRVQLKASSKNYVAFESWLTDETLHRFLIARQYSVVKAVKLIESALVWREKRNPNRFLPRPGPKFEALFEVEMTTGKMYIAGFDRWGRTVIVFNNTVQNTTSHNDQMDYLSWLLETAILLSAARSVDKYVIFMHLDSFSFFNCPPMKTTHETVMMLTSAYPERLGHMVCYHAPSVFHTVFNSLKPWIDKRTCDKLVFVYGSVEDGSANDGTMRTVLGDHWKVLTGADQPVLKKGSSPGFDHAAVWKQHLGHIEAVEKGLGLGEKSSVPALPQPQPQPQTKGEGERKDKAGVAAAAVTPTEARAGEEEEAAAAATEQQAEHTDSKLPLSAPGGGAVHLKAEATLPVPVSTLFLLTAAVLALIVAVLIARVSN